MSHPAESPPSGAKARSGRSGHHWSASLSQPSDAPSEKQCATTIASGKPQVLPRQRSHLDRVGGVIRGEELHIVVLEDQYRAAVGRPVLGKLWQLAFQNTDHLLKRLCW